MRGLAAAVALIASAGLGQPRVVQLAGTVMAPSLTFPAPVLEGSTIVVVANWDDATGLQDVTLTDDQGLSWAEVAPAVHGAPSGSAMNAHVFRAVAHAGPLTITPSLATYNTVAFEYAGLEAFPLTSSVGGGGTTPGALLRLDAGPDAFGFAYLLTYGTPAATPAGWLEVSRWDGDFYAQAGPGDGGWTLDLSCSDRWVAQLIAFAPAPDAGVDAGLEGPPPHEEPNARKTFSIGCSTTAGSGWLAAMLLVCRRRRPV